MTRECGCPKGRWCCCRKPSQWPRPDDLDQMSPEEFDAYVERIGFDARIRAALAEPVDA